MWYLVVIVVAALVSVALAPKPPEQTGIPVDVDAPTAEEGRPIPVVFGTVLLRGRNVVWYGDLEAEPIARKVARNEHSDRHHHRHVRAVGLCVNGTRTWFERHDLDFRAFLREGCDAETFAGHRRMRWPARRGRARPQSIQPAGARLMGGSSKSKPSATATGWVCIWPCARAVDAVQEIQMGDRTAWGDADRAPLSSGHGLTSLSSTSPPVWRRRARRRRGRHHRCAALVMPDRDATTT